MSKKGISLKAQALIYFFSVLIMSFILFPLLDMLWCAIITHTNFSYNPQDYILEPFIFSILITLFFYIPVITRKAKTEKKKK